MVGQWKHVLVTVGTTRFDRLVDQMTDDNTLRVLSERGCVELTIQLGSSAVSVGKPIHSNEYNIHIKTFDYKDSILEDIKSADLVIGHAGAGTALEVLRAHKPLVMVINRDLMGNHQKELADRLQTDSYIMYCYTNTLVDSLISLDTNQLKPFPEPNPLLFRNFIENIFFTDKQKSEKTDKKLK